MTTKEKAQAKIDENFEQNKVQMMVSLIEAQDRLGAEIRRKQEQIVKIEADKEKLERITNLQDLKEFHSGEYAYNY